MLSFEEFILEQETQGQLKRLALAVSIDMPDNEYIYDSKYSTSKMFNLITKDDSIFLGYWRVYSNFSYFRSTSSSRESTIFIGW